MVSDQSHIDARGEDLGELTLVDVALLLVAGVGAGIVNTLVGGGTSIVVPILVLGFGVDTHEANGTNRLAVCFQGVAALWTLRRVTTPSAANPNGVPLGRWSEVGQPALLAFFGAIPGAYIATQLPPEQFKRWVGILLLVAIVFFFVRPRKGSASHPGKTPWGAVIVAFLIGVYGGFLGAGVGVLILLLLRPLLGVSLVEMVPVKVAMVFLLSLSASVVYIAQGQVLWNYALPLVIANIIGGIVGAKLAVLGGDRWIRRVLAVVAAGLALRLLWG